MVNFHGKPSVYVGKVKIKVRDLKKSVQFYEEIIGLHVLEQTEQKVVLSANGKSALVTLEQPANIKRKPERTTGLYHFALLLPTRADLSVFLKHLLETRYPLGASDHYVSEAIYLNDPDGNGIEVYRDRPAHEWNWKDGLVSMSTVQLDGEGILAESVGSKWSGLPAGTKMGHIHLHVDDLKRAEEFYTVGLGFEVVSYYPQAAFLSTSGYHHHIAINTWQGAGAGAPPENSIGLDWYTLIYPNEEDRKAAVNRVKQLGAVVIEEGTAMITRDSAGNQIRLMVE